MVSELRPGFFASKNCTAPRLKVQSSFLYPPMTTYYLDFSTQSHELFMSLNKKSDELELHKKHGDTKQRMPCSKPEIQTS